MSARNRKEDFLSPDKVYPGMKIYYKNVTFEVIEHNIVRGYRNKRTHVITYRLIDGNYVSPKAHIFCNDGEDVRRYINSVIEFYLRNKEYVQRVTKR